ncbi:MAG: hypothetical protein PWR20_1727 [Bacteroidales bacterium]|jgi:hypothetical protein|nr:hypothetical protein [Bacteroidales bacterium]MDN5329827.1 hypothetical protein [Bacteroidales bacterium]
MIKRLKTIQFLVSERKLQEAGEELSALDNEHQALKEEISRLLELRDFEALEDILSRHIHELSLPSKGEPFIIGLRTNLALLSTRLSVALNKKADLQRQINAFRQRHNSELGMLMGDILRLQMDLFYLRQQKDARYHEAFRQAQKDYSSFKNQQKHISKERPHFEISREERNRLRKLYREASKRCHPDMVDPEMREEARQWFIELNNAYLYNDIRKVEEIYQLLSNDLFTENKEKVKGETSLLEARINRLNGEIMRVEEEIKEMMSSPVYKTIRQITDFDAYFAELRAKLEREYELIKQEYVRESAEKRL